MLARLIDALRPIYGTSGEIAVLGSSGTGALEAAVVNLFSPGERLLSCAVGAFGKRLAAIARAYGCEVESLETSPGAALDPQALRGRLESDTERRIDGILLTQNETSTGVANDMAAIAPIVRAHGALIGCGRGEWLRRQRVQNGRVGLRRRRKRFTKSVRRTARRGDDRIERAWSRALQRAATSALLPRSRSGVRVRA